MRSFRGPFWSIPVWFTFWLIFVECKKVLLLFSNYGLQQLLLDEEAEEKETEEENAPIRAS